MSMNTARSDLSTEGYTVQTSLLSDINDGIAEPCRDTIHGAGRTPLVMFYGLTTWTLDNFSVSFAKDIVIIVLLIDGQLCDWSSLGGNTEKWKREIFSDYTNFGHSQAYKGRPESYTRVMFILFYAKVNEIRPRKNINPFASAHISQFSVPTRQSQINNRSNRPRPRPPPLSPPESCKTVRVDAADGPGFRLVHSSKQTTRSLHRHSVFIDFDDIINAFSVKKVRRKSLEFTRLIDWTLQLVHIHCCLQTCILGPTISVNTLHCLHCFSVVSCPHPSDNALNGILMYQLVLSATGWMDGTAPLPHRRNNTDELSTGRHSEHAYRIGGAAVARLCGVRRNN
ncbi:hypothetical protein ANN_24290 [Periplaneta americana]|uniref:Uncharacterized protein n=1 Tax=Periplaneta americana TaxID=6978 RepID=A0ABQ8S2Q0_PERAM|nr:hypothetical protein ANN_24290 [Periplaneta americana]